MSGLANVPTSTVDPDMADMTSTKPLVPLEVRTKFKVKPKTERKGQILVQMTLLPLLKMSKSKSIDVLKLQTNLLSK
jgi:hypothetical protein